MKKKESLLDLVEQATQLYRDRAKLEADLIYFVAKLDNEERTALILAYQNLYEREE
jgi:hypothetical protein